MSLRDGIPVYVTRKTSNGYIGAVWANAAAVSLLITLVMLLALLWACIGIYAGIEFIVDVTA